MPRKKTKEEFIKEAVMVHGNKYDYSKVVYVNNNTKVEIICPEHGSFFQLPRTRASTKCGCPKCSNVASDRDLFIEKASIVYPHYDYSKVDYIKSNVKVSIICPEHGVFVQTPNNLLNGHGCPQCSKNKRILDRNTLIYGVARNDYKGSCVDDNGDLLKSYDIWYGMIRRCYDSKSLEYKTTYQDCTVCDEWLFFSNFKEWFDENYQDGYSLDKDIRIHNNRIYSPETCCFVPKEINTIFITNKNKRGDFYIGVSHNGANYTATLLKWGKTCYLGVFLTEEEAFLAYKREKESFIKEVANKYKDKLSDIAYNALMNYEVEITD